MTLWHGGMYPGTYVAADHLPEPFGRFLLRRQK
jgi:hypothetical protein